MMDIFKYVMFSFFYQVFYIAVCAQQPLNLNFEIKSIEGINRPWGWDLKSWGPAIFKMDSLVVKNGKFSLSAVCNVNPGDCKQQAMSFGIEPYELRNKKISVSGFIKTEALNGNAGFSLGYTYPDSNNESFLEKDTTSIGLSGNSQWKNYTVELNIPEKAQMVYVTVNYAGNGKAWFDDFKLNVSGRSVNAVAVAKPLSKLNLAWLNNHSSVVHAVVPTSTYTDPAAFKKAVGNSRLIALGEATHGTSEFFSLKNRLFQYAVTELGFRVFAIEDNQLAVEKVNKYVHGGAGTVAESMSAMFDVWNRAEVLALVEWMRAYNEKHPADQLSFAGFDMQEIARPVDSLLHFLKTQDSDLYNNTVVFLQDLKENGPKSYSFPDSIKLVWFNSANEILEQVKLKSKNWLSYSRNSLDSQKIIFGIQYANLVRQFAENTYKGHWSLYRDEAMAENISWLLETRSPGSRIFIWAHDVHISRGDHPNQLLNLNSGISMGSFLSKKYGSLYKCFSLSTYAGEYLAMKSYTDFTKLNCPLFKAPVGSLDEALHRIAVAKKVQNLFLPLPRAEDWLNTGLPKRFANHVSIDYGYWERVSIPYQFDGMFFIDKTTAAKSLKK